MSTLTSSVRFQYLVSELGSLLRELRVWGASFEDLARANKLADNATPDNIGGVIHDIQAQLEDVKFSANRDGIGPDMVELFERIEFEDLQ